MVYAEGEEIMRSRPFATILKAGYSQKIFSIWFHPLKNDTKSFAPQLSKGQLISD